MSELCYKSYKYKTELLVSGYIKENYLQKTIKKYNYYDQALASLFVQFLGNIFFKFDLCHNKFKHEIINDGFEIKRDGTEEDVNQIIFACSRGVNEGIYEWRIKTMTNVQPNCGDGIGIATNIEPLTNTDKESIWIHNVQRDHNASFLHGGGSFYPIDKRNRSVDADEWSKGDIITIIINCDDWTVKFFMNDKLLGNKAYDIPKNMTYHLVISSQYGGQHYILLH